MTRLNYDASKLLHAHLDNNRFIHRLEIDDDERITLLAVRKKARSAIRKAFNEAEFLLKEEFEKESTLLKIHSSFQELKPAFWGQGSFSYGTLNNPAQSPPQQLDLDDGVYLPMELFEDKPIYSKEIFFKIVDKALKKLVDENQGWKFHEKDTCARIEVSPRIHLDFPLYAVPRERFEEIRKSDELALESYRFDAVFAENIVLDPEEIYLARRDKEHWVKSDPKKIKLWFDSEKQVHGRRLVRVCRYLKAWRDHTWKHGGATSITLMACAALVFDESEGFDRDCEALFAVVERLPELFSGEIENPAEPEEILYPRHLSSKERIDIIEKSQEFKNKLTNALIHAENSQEVVNLFIDSLGERIPNNTCYVESILSVSKVLNTPVSKQPAPKVKNVKSG